MPDEEDDYVEGRLADATVMWLTTVRSDAQPQTSPVWFVWDGESFLLYSRPRSQKVSNIRANPKVALNLDGDGTGGGIVSFEGSAEIDDAAPPPHHEERYLRKYEGMVRDMGTDPETFAKAYATAIRITPTRRRVYQ